MHRYLAPAALLITAPLAAQTPPPTDHGAMSGMDHAEMSKSATPTPAMDRSKMAPMDHPKMGGMSGMGDMPMMKNTPANPYAEAGMAMRHKMMVVGTDASETWTRQMIEHHRGAIAMSKIAVTQAKDKDVRTMAERDIPIQEKDVASLQSWLKRNGKSAQ